MDMNKHLSELVAQGYRPRRLSMPEQPVPSNFSSGFKAPRPLSAGLDGCGGLRHQLQRRRRTVLNRGRQAFRNCSGRRPQGVEEHAAEVATRAEALARHLCVRATRFDRPNGRQFGLGPRKTPLRLLELFSGLVQSVAKSAASISPDLHEKARRLKGAVLGCWCHPKQCHGHFIADFVNEGR